MLGELWTVGLLMQVSGEMLGSEMVVVASIFWGCSRVLVLEFLDWAVLWGFNSLAIEILNSLCFIVKAPMM